jgi:hypothetical protein
VTILERKSAMKMPSTIYVTQEGDKGEEYLVALAAIQDHAVIGDKRKIAVYKLEKMVELEGIVSVRNAKTR